MVARMVDLSGMEAQDPLPLTEDELRRTVAALLADARAQEPPDHAACAKYADLLYKMLVKSGGPKKKAGSFEGLLAQLNEEERK